MFVRRVVLIERSQRFCLKRLKRIASGELLERDEIAHRQLDDFSQQCIAVEKRNVWQRQLRCCQRIAVILEYAVDLIGRETERGLQGKQVILERHILIIQVQAQWMIEDGIALENVALEKQLAVKRIGARGRQR